MTSKIIPVTICSILEDSITLTLPTPSLLRSGKLNFPLIQSRCVSLFLPNRPHYHHLTALTSPSSPSTPQALRHPFLPPLHLGCHLFIPSHKGTAIESFCFKTHLLLALTIHLDATRKNQIEFSE